MLVGRRIAGKVHVYDHPRASDGRRYFVDAGFRSVVELAVLVSHYRRHATLLGTCPMTREAIDKSFRGVGLGVAGAGSRHVVGVPEPDSTLESTP